MEDDKQKVYGAALQTVGNIKKIVKNTGEELTAQGQSMDKLNNKLDTL
jgi:hypothetical protein